MNNFARIKHIDSYKFVKYYSVCLGNDGDVSVFEKFIEKHSHENSDKLKHIMSWIQVIGNKYSAKSDYFRNEAETADTSALPPNNPNLEPTFIDWDCESQSGEPNSLRLYTFRANDYVVFLFNGDVKTADTAQACDNVRPHFKLANKLTELIDKSFGNGIDWNTDYTDIIIEEEFELNW